MFPIRSSTSVMFLCLGIALSTSGCKPLKKEGGSTVSYGPEFGIPPDPPEPPAAPKPPRPPKTTEGPGWDAVRKALLDPKNCYGNKLEYCVKDQDFVNPVIQAVLDKRYDGVMPNTPAKIEEVVQETQLRYADALQTADGRRRVESLVESRFRNPVVTEQGNGVAISLNLGFLPEKIRVLNGYLSPTRDRLDGGYWKSRELAKALKDALDAYPHADFVALTFEYPEDEYSPYTYSYNKQTDRLTYVHRWTRGHWLTEPLGRDFTPYVSGEKSLYSTMKASKTREPH